MKLAYCLAVAAGLAAANASSDPCSKLQRKKCMATNSCSYDLKTDSCALESVIARTHSDKSEEEQLAEWGLSHKLDEMSCSEAFGSMKDCKNINQHYQKATGNADNKCTYECPNGQTMRGKDPNNYLHGHVKSDGECKDAVDGVATWASCVEPPPVVVKGNCFPYIIDGYIATEQSPYTASWTDDNPVGSAVGGKAANPLLTSALYPEFPNSLGAQECWDNCYANHGEELGGASIYIDSCYCLPPCDNPILVPDALGTTFSGDHYLTMMSHKEYTKNYEPSGGLVVANSGNTLCEQFSVRTENWDFGPPCDIKQHCPKEFRRTYDASSQDDGGECYCGVDPDSPDTANILCNKDWWPHVSMKPYKRQWYGPY